MRHPTTNSEVGLCEECQWARRIESKCDSVFYMCRRAAGDARYAKYPRLPVLECEGFGEVGELQRPKRAVKSLS